MAVSTISGAIKWTGLASGTDFGNVVNQLVAVEERTVKRQETWQNEWKKKLTAITELDTRLGALKLDAQSYDAREELLSRASSSSDEKVVTLTNLSTAATGIYEVEVGANIREKVGSKTYQNSKAIGGSTINTVDLSGVVGGAPGDHDALLGPDGKPVLLPGAAKSPTTPLGANEYYDVDSGGYPIDDQSPPNILYNLLTYVNSAGEPAEMGGALITDDFPPGSGLQPFTITLGGQTLTLKYNAQAAPGNAAGHYNGAFTMRELADTINATVAAPGYAGPNIKAEILYDKTRQGDDYSRLVITGGEGGSANHITISDPTDLGLDRKNFDDPVTTSLVGTTALPRVVDNAAYTGCGNKTVTFVATSTGTLGQNDIAFSWADTEGNRGSFTLKAADWDSVAGRMTNDIEIIQGLKLNFGYGSNGSFVANEAFTIDCQTPVMQQAADSGLATTDKWIHRGWPDQTSPVTFGAAGKFDFSYAGLNYSVPVADGLGLSALADAINNHAKNPGVIATIINDGMGTATSYKLVLTGVDSGVEHGIEILSTTSLNRMDCSPASFDHARRASNSMSRIDGYPNDGVSWLQRPTNEVGDAVDGTVITLVGPGKSTITIRNNVSDMENKIKALVTSVNTTKAYIKQQTKWGEGKLVSNVLADGTLERATEGGEESGIMIGNYGFQIALSELDKLMTKAIFTRAEYIQAIDPGRERQYLLPQAEQQALYDQYLEANGLIYTRLSDIGIASNHDQAGTYTIEESKLRECLTKNPEAVIKLFTFVPPETDMSRVVVHEDEEARPRLAGFGVQLGYRMSDLTRSSDVINPSTGEVVKPAKGITKVLGENYADIISGIDTKIAREKKRIEMYRQRMEQKFARLETALAQLNNTSESVSAQLAQLSGSSSS
ncbi:hypothetical protein FACS189460_1720 [Deltaproteobacteria bacterium]|nr:hypothetical protein FACS189460_1720 [Deltaproteobacteria bacterium]